jgi:hypothetical protein
MVSTTYGQEYYKIKLLELKGKVKCIRIIPEVIKENPTNQKTNNRIMLSTYDRNAFIFFNREGYYTKNIIFNDNNDTIFVNNVSYKDNKWVQSEEQINKETFKTIFIEVEFDKDHKIETRYFHDNILKSLKSKQVRHLNKYNEYVTDTIYNHLGSMAQRTLYTYNERGICLSESVFDENNNPIFIVKKKLDNKNRMIEEEVTVFSPNEYTFASVRTYDKGIFPIKMENIDSHGRRETATMKYQIDKKGNWIRKEFYNDYGLYLVIKREITYY